MSKKNPRIFPVMLNNREIGTVWQDEMGWCCNVSINDVGWDGIDTKAEAIQAVRDAHAEHCRSAFVFIPLS